MSFTHQSIVRWLLSAIIAMASAPAWSVACSQFVDIPEGATYCSAAEWLRQRGVSVGCVDATHYCPADTVTRASMALFIKRAADVAQPTIVYQRETFSLTVANLAVTTCATAVVPAVNYPRMATVSAVAYMWGAPGYVVAYPQYSYAATGQWQDWAQDNVATSIDSLYASLSVISPTLYVAPGLTVRFAMAAYAGTPVVNGSCRLRARVENYNGPPF